jgi:surfeit locus 1 family protein
MIEMVERGPETREDRDQDTDDDETNEVQRAGSGGERSIVPRLRVALRTRVFEPALAPTLIALPLFVLLIALGSWQLQRAAAKRALFAAFERDAAAPVALTATPAPRYTRVRTGGHYLAGRQFLLDNMTHDGVAGYRVLTPFECADRTTLLVDRGWIPVGESRARLPDLAVGEGPREVAGRVDQLPRAGLELRAGGGSGWPRVVSFPKLADLAALLGRPVYPQVLLLDPGLPDGFVRVWRPPGLPPEQHVGYALQWYALALTLLVCYVIVSLKRRR